METDQKSSHLSAAGDFQAGYPRVPSFLVAVFCCYVVVWYLQLGNRIPFLGSIRFEYILAGFLLTVGFFFTPKIDTDCPLFIYVASFFLVLSVSLVFSYDFDESLEVFIDRILKFSCMAWFIICFVRSPKHMKYFMAAFLLVCFKMGEEGFLGRITGSMIWENQGIMRLHGATDLYSHPNSFSGMALGTLPFVFAYWSIANKYVKLFLFVLAIFSLNIIIYSGSRTGYVGLLFLVVTVLLMKGLKKQVFLLVILLLFSLPLLPQQYVERFESIFTLQEKEGYSTEKRIEIIKDAVKIFGGHPLGVGIRAFPKVRFQYFERSQDTHNLYLEVATNLGVQGCIVFFLLIFKLLTMLRSMDKNLKGLLDQNLKLINEEKTIAYVRKNAQQNVADIRFASATAVAVFNFVLVRLSLGLFGMDLYEIYWWFAIGTAVSLYSINKTLNARTQELT